MRYSEPTTTVCGPLRTINFLYHTKESGLLLPEEERQNCNNGNHYWYIDKIQTMETIGFDVRIKWYCLFCHEQREKTVNPNEETL
jgi:hypothetical protein